MYSRTTILATILSVAILQTAMSVPIQKSDFVEQAATILDFEDYSGFVGGPGEPDPWLSEGIRIWGYCSGSEMWVSIFDPKDKNTVTMEFLDPKTGHPWLMQKVGADVTFSITTTTRLEVYDLQGNPIEHIDGVGPTFLGIDVGSPIIASAKFIDLPDAWDTFPNIDNLHFEVPEPATLCLLALGGIALFRRRRS